MDHSTPTAATTQPVAPVYTDGELDEQSKKMRNAMAEMWSMFRQDQPAAEVQGYLHKSTYFQSLDPQWQQALDNFTVVMDPSKSTEERVGAAMRTAEIGNVGDNPDHGKAGEQFLGKIFKGFTQDGNIANDQEAIRHIERALNGLHVNVGDKDVTLQVTEDGVADARLAMLLRTPEVMAAMKQAKDSGALPDVEFTPEYQFTPDAVRFNNPDRQQGNSR